MSFSKNIKIILGDYYVKSNGISYYVLPDEIRIKNKLYELDSSYYKPISYYYFYKKSISYYYFF